MDFKQKNIIFSLCAGLLVLWLGLVSYTLFRAQENNTKLQNEISALRSDLYPNNINENQEVGTIPIASDTKNDNLNIAAAVSSERRQNGSNSNSVATPKESSKEVVKKITDIVGDIKEVKGDVLVIEAKIVDLGKIDQTDELKSEAYPTIIKKYSVTTNKDTVFSVKKYSELKAGDTVRAFSKNPVYSSSEFLATDVTYLTAEDLSLLGQ